MRARERKAFGVMPNLLRNSRQKAERLTKPARAQIATVDWSVRASSEATVGARLVGAAWRGRLLPVQRRCGQGVMLQGSERRQHETLTTAEIVRRASYDSKYMLRNVRKVVTSRVESRAGSATAATDCGGQRRVCRARGRGLGEGVDSWEMNRRRTGCFHPRCCIRSQAMVSTNG